MVSRKCYTRKCSGRLRTQYDKQGMPYKVCSHCEYDGSKKGEDV